MREGKPDESRREFLEALARLGGSAGNGRLCETLGWERASYDAVRSHLIEEGAIVPGRGRGGSVTLAEKKREDDQLAADLLSALGLDEPESAQAADKPQGKPATTKKGDAKQRKVNANGANLGFEAELFKTADKLRGNMEPSDYKHVALGLIFLRYISIAFELKHAELLAEWGEEEAEERDSYTADNVFWVPKAARWSRLQANAKQPGIGQMIDEAMRAIEEDNPSLKAVLPKEYGRPALSAVMLGELIDLISNIDLGDSQDRARDTLGRVYEYFLAQFAGSEGKRGGEFYTPRSVVRVMTEMLEPYKGRVYDPCCGSGGMFVQSEKFVEAHGGRIGIKLYGGWNTSIVDKIRYNLVTSVRVGTA